MEGDVIGVAAPQAAVHSRYIWAFVLLLVSGVLGLVWAALRSLGKRVMTEIDDRLKRIEAAGGTYAEDLRRLERDVQQLRTELPMSYQRRDDALREYTAINVKLDRLYELWARTHWTPGSKG